MICGNCRAKTDDKDEVKACYEHGPSVHRAPGPAPTQPPPESRPFSTFQHMQPDPPQVQQFDARYGVNAAANEYTERYASRTKRPPTPPYKWPLPMLETIPDGYYAARLDDNDPYEFYRVSHPKKNKYAGCIKVQTMHGERLQIFAVRWRDGNLWMVPHERARFEEPFLMVLADHKHCQQLYAEKTGHCGRCGKQLTDDRSLYYGIGPECEKYMPEYFAMIDDLKGVYSGPQGISA